jgi:uncharacterized damage-inducible protein DinB
METTTNIEQLKYPIGKYQRPQTFAKEQFTEWINTIESFPAKLIKEISNLSEEQLNTPYRPEGWTIRQVVHHCADSHMNAFIRFKLAMTEDKPTIKPYMEDRWAKLPDTALAPIEFSFQILEGLHKRWIILLKSMSEEDFKRQFIHPEMGRELEIRETLALYAWHCNHHLSHITSLKERMKWN